MGEREDSLAAEHRRLQHAAFSRDGGPEALAELAAFERRLADDRAATVAPFPTASSQQPLDGVLQTGTQTSEPIRTTPDAVSLPANRRRWVPVAIGLSVVLVIGAIVAVRPLIGGPSAKPIAATSGRVTNSPVVSTAPSVSFASYEGTADCYNLVDVDALSMFARKGYDNISVEYAVQQATKNNSPLYYFLRTRGLVCAWGSDVAQAVYAYGPITAEERIAWGNRLLQLGYEIRDGYDGDRYSNDFGTYQFGDGFWAYSTSGTNDVLDEVVAHAPENAGKRRADVQSSVYVTSEGMGDLRLGSPVPRDSEVATWYPDACGIGSGAYRPGGNLSGHSELSFDPITAQRNRSSDLASILIYSSQIPTKSGIRVGDPVDAVTKAFPGIENKNFELVGTVGKIKFVIGSVDLDQPEIRVVTAIYVVRIHDDFPEGTNSDGSCAT